ncbi:MAG: copper amine oxidase N-terminal domain-containing protein [Eubacterium sp.]|nr:copper amine oxidase N-terminal domain-containing protein [Eubacterium sp.]
MKRTFSVISAALLAVGMSSTAFAADLNVTVEGTPVAWTDAKPFIDENSRTLVPLRPIANALDLEVSWNDDTNTASFTNDIVTVDFIVDSPEYRAYMNGFGVYAYTEMDTKAVIRDSRIYAPARYLAEAFGYDVGWEEATKSVTIVKAEFAEEETIKLPEVPTGEVAAVFPITTEAGTETSTIISVNGVTFKEDPDFFEYDYKLDVDMELLGQGMVYEFAEGYVIPDLQPELSVTPGTYPVSWTLPAEWFTDAEEDVVVSTTLTVTAPTAETALNLAMENVEYGVYVEQGAAEADVSAMILEDTVWLLEGTSFTVVTSEGEYDVSGGEWTGTITVTDTATSETASKVMTIPVNFFSDF